MESQAVSGLRLHGVSGRLGPEGLKNKIFVQSEKKGKCIALPYDFDGLTLFKKKLSELNGASVFSARRLSTGALPALRYLKYQK